METMGHNFDVRYMEIDKEMLATYRQLLTTTKEHLAYTQFNDLLTRIDISPTKRLETSYRSLFNTIDKHSFGSAEKIYAKLLINFVILLSRRGVVIHTATD
jgi:hypothetical protein